MTTTNERRAEIERFLSKNPDADNKLVVDNMMEKFEGTKRHQHRAMVQRVRKNLNGSLNTPEVPSVLKEFRDAVAPEMEKALKIPKTGRSSSKQENVSNLPKEARIDTGKLIQEHERLEGMTLKALREECKSKGLPVKGSKADLVQRLFEYEPPNAVSEPAKKPTPRKERKKSGKALPPQKRGRKPRDWPDIKPEATLNRRAMVIDQVLSRRKAKREEIIDAVAEEFPAPSREATAAMIKSARLALVRYKAKPEEDVNERAVIEARYAKQDKAVCPVCGCTAKHEDQIQKVFGYRLDFERRQSNCRACRKQKLKDAKQTTK